MEKSTALKGNIAMHKEKREKIKKENAERGTLLKKIMKDGARGAGVSAHNAVIAAVYLAVMALVAYIAVQAAFYLVATMAGATGSYLMETPADVLTVYVILAMCCGFCLFAAFAAFKAIWKAARRRFWHTDRKTGTVDKGELWRERHGEDCGDGRG